MYMYMYMYMYICIYVYVYGLLVGLKDFELFGGAGKGPAWNGMRGRKHLVSVATTLRRGVARGLDSGVGYNVEGVVAACWEAGPRGANAWLFLSPKNCFN